MQVLRNKQGETIAFLLMNCVLEAQSLQVIGITLGDVLYGNAHVAVGKFIHQHLFDLKGNIVASLDDEPLLGDHLLLDKQRITDELWRLMLAIQSHSCDWIPEGKQWSPHSLKELLA